MASYHQGVLGDVTDTQFSIIYQSPFFPWEKSFQGTPSYLSLNLLTSCWLPECLSFVLLKLQFFMSCWIPSTEFKSARYWTLCLWFSKLIWYVPNSRLRKSPSYMEFLVCWELRVCGSNCLQSPLSFRRCIAVTPNSRSTKCLNYCHQQSHGDMG